MNELDRIMSEDPLNLSAKDIDDYIEYCRRKYQEYTSGVKPKRETEAKISLSSIIPMKPVVTNRRKL